MNRCGGRLGVIANSVKKHIKVTRMHDTWLPRLKISTFAKHVRNWRNSRNANQAVATYRGQEGNYVQLILILVPGWRHGNPEFRLC